MLARYNYRPTPRWLPPSHEEFILRFRLPQTTRDQPVKHNARIALQDPQ